MGGGGGVGWVVVIDVDDDVGVVGVVRDGVFVVFVVELKEN